METNDKGKWGDEAPGVKHYIFVLVAVALLVALSWISWFKWGWFH